MSEEFIKKKVGYEVAITHVDPDELYDLMATTSYCEMQSGLDSSLLPIAAKQDESGKVFSG